MMKYERTTYRDHREVAQRSAAAIFEEILAELYAESGTSAQTHTPFYESVQDGHLTRFTVTLYPHEIAERIARRLREGPSST